MYLHIGGEVDLRTEEILFICDMDNATASHITRAALRRAEQNGETVTAGDELPKSFILTAEFGINRVYFSQFGPATLEKRTK